MPRSSSPKPDALAEGRTSINKIDSQQSIFDGLSIRPFLRGPRKMPFSIFLILRA
jgi:hypothetical protein